MPFQIHRDTDPRSCGASTTVQNQSSVYVNNLLWAVKGSFNSHGAGGLINSGTTVFVENTPIIVNAPDAAQPDNLCPVSAEHCNPFTAGGSSDCFCY